jgi:hypothetical protein
MIHKEISFEQEMCAHRGATLAILPCPEPR